MKREMVGGRDLIYTQKARRMVLNKEGEMVGAKSLFSDGRKFVGSKFYLQPNTCLSMNDINKFIRLSVHGLYM